MKRSVDNTLTQSKCITHKQTCTHTPINNLIHSKILVNRNSTKLECTKETRYQIFAKLSTYSAKTTKYPRMNDNRQYKNKVNT